MDDVVDPFERDLAAVINKHSKENGSNTPDFILAKFLNVCLMTFEGAVAARETWYGAEFKPGRIVTQSLTPAEYAEHVSVSSRVHATLYLGDRAFDSVTEIVKAAYADGLAAAGRRE
jgi:hypothetical protein